jgi:hypothetical protein
MKNRQVKFVFATVIFPEIQPFFAEFSESLRKQKDHDFHILIVNDGANLSNFDFTGLDYTILNSGGSIVENRLMLIHEADNRDYEWIVFADADDWFESNRIATIKKFSHEYDLIANEIVPFSGNRFSEPKFEKILGHFSQIDLNFILDKNLFGLSNVACRTKFLKQISIPDDIIAVDWYLFTKAIQSGARACFTAESKTYYRQWYNNIIGIDKTSEKEIRIGIKAKYAHFKNLAESNSWFATNFLWINQLYNQLEDSDFDSYINKLWKADLTTTFWWENIKNYEDE